MYGATSIADLKRALLTYRREGRLDQVKMISLTKCTCDGIVYDVERVMTECLAIEPDLVFLWDEAWFAFARCHPVYRRRTAMAAMIWMVSRHGSRTNSSDSALTSYPGTLRQLIVAHFGGGLGPHTA